MIAPGQHPADGDLAQAGMEMGMELTDSIMWMLKQASHYSLKSLNDAISGHGVTTAHIGLMRQLANEPGLSGAELARRLLITPQAALFALGQLESRGLVERKPDPEHGRILKAYLTEQGRAVTAAGLADALAADERVFSVLSPGEQQLLRELLRRIVEQGTGHPLFTDHIER
jgi:DNA-binding MarR family transcriptional regulator